MAAQLQRLVIAAHQCVGQKITLTPPQQHYLTRVLRLNRGDSFIAILETGQWWLAELDMPDAHCLEPIACETELAQPLTLLAAVPKGQGFEEIVRAATELGVTTLIPLLTARTVMQPNAPKVERWRRIATEAAEQSQRRVVPSIHAPTPFATALALTQTPAFQPQLALICVTGQGGKNLVQALVNQPQMGTLIMVGPEGGWTETEQAQAIAAGFLPVSLGRRILRAVTASLAAVAILSAAMEAPPAAATRPNENKS